MEVLCCRTWAMQVGHLRWRRLVPWTHVTAFNGIYLNHAPLLQRARAVQENRASAEVVNHYGVFSNRGALLKRQTASFPGGPGSCPAAPVQR